MNEGYTFEEINSMSPLQLKFAIANKVYWGEKKKEEMDKSKRKGRRTR